MAHYGISSSILEELAALVFRCQPLEAAVFDDDGCCQELLQSRISLYQQMYEMLCVVSVIR